MEISEEENLHKDCSRQSHVQAHATKTAIPFLENHGMVEISHSPYSPNFVSTEFLLFIK